MDTELKALLEENLKISQENNVLLKKLRKSARIASITRALYWVVIIGLTVGSFYYLEPYLNKVKSIYDSGALSLDKIQVMLNSVPNVKSK